MLQSYTAEMRNMADRQNAKAQVNTAVNKVAEVPPHHPSMKNIQKDIFRRASTVRVLGNNAEGGGFAFAALDSDSESNWTSSSSDTDSDADTMNWKVNPQNHATAPKSLSLITPVANIDVEQMKNMKQQLYKRMATAPTPSDDTLLKD